MDICRTEFALNLTRFHLRNFVAVVTEHCVYAKGVRIPNNDFSRRNNDAKKKIPDYLFCHCPTLVSPALAK